MIVVTTARRYLFASLIAARLLDFGPIPIWRRLWKLTDEATDEPAPSRNPSQSVAVAAGVCASGPGRGEAQARSSYPPLCSIGAGDSAAGDPAYPRYGVSGCEDR